MEVFLSSEAEYLADVIISPIRNEINKKIKLLLEGKDETYYGKDIGLLAIITTCVSAQFLEVSGWKERVRYLKKDQSTDIRLNIDYETLVSATPEDRYTLYVDNIIQSVRQFQAKYPRLDFKAETFIDDLLNVLNIN